MFEHLNDLYDSVGPIILFLKYLVRLSKFKVFIQLLKNIEKYKDLIIEILEAIISALGIFESDYYTEYAKEYDLKYDICPDSEYINFYSQYISPRLYMKFDGPFKADPYLKSKLLSKEEECKLHYIRTCLDTLIVKNSKCHGRLMRICSCMKHFITFEFKDTFKTSFEGLNLKLLNIGDDIENHLEIKFLKLRKRNEPI